MATNEGADNTSAQRRSRATPELLKVAGEIINILDQHTDVERVFILETVDRLYEVTRATAEGKLGQTEGPRQQTLLEDETLNFQLNQNGNNGAGEPAPAAAAPAPRPDGA